MRRQPLPAANAGRHDASSLIQLRGLIVHARAVAGTSIEGSATLIMVRVLLLIGVFAWVVAADGLRPHELMDDASTDFRSAAGRSLQQVFGTGIMTLASAGDNFHAELDNTLLVSLFMRDRIVIGSNRPWRRGTCLWDVWEAMTSSLACAPRGHTFLSPRGVTCSNPRNRRR